MFDQKCTKMHHHWCIFSAYLDKSAPKVHHQWCTFGAFLDKSAPKVHQHWCKFGKFLENMALEGSNLRWFKILFPGLKRGCWRPSWTPAAARLCSNGRDMVPQHHFSSRIRASLESSLCLLLLLLVLVCGVAWWPCIGPCCSWYCCNLCLKPIGVSYQFTNPLKLSQMGLIMSHLLGKCWVCHDVCVLTHIMHMLNAQCSLNT